MNITLSFTTQQAKDVAALFERFGLADLARKLRAQMAEAAEKARRRRDEAEARGRFEAERQMAEEACRREGHPALRRSIIVDGKSSRYVYVRECARCGEPFVILADGTWMEWLAWTREDPRKPLAEEMFGDPERQ